jgi:CheY-like chemotaxis protein
MSLTIILPSIHQSINHQSTQYSLYLLQHYRYFSMQASTHNNNAAAVSSSSAVPDGYSNLSGSSNSHAVGSSSSKGGNRGAYNGSSPRGRAGVSLAICKEIVSKHCGVLGIRSVPDEKPGSEFYFSVPVREAPAAASVAKPHPSPVAQTELSSSGSSASSSAKGTAKDSSSSSSSSSSSGAGAKCVLVVDDVATNRKFLGMLLRRLPGLDLDVHTASSGHEALELFLEAPDRYDVIFMDSQMPGMSGLEAAQKLRAGVGGGTYSVLLLLLSSGPSFLPSFLSLLVRLSRSLDLSIYCCLPICIL